MTCLEEASVIVGFMCQPDWIMGYADIWLNIISECVCECFQLRTAFESVG